MQGTVRVKFINEVITKFYKLESVAKATCVDNERIIKPLVSQKRAQKVVP